MTLSSDTRLTPEQIQWNLLEIGYWNPVRRFTDRDVGDMAPEIWNAFEALERQGLIRVVIIQDHGNYHNGAAIHLTPEGRKHIEDRWMDDLASALFYDEHVLF